MLLRRFTDSDILQSPRLAKLTWGNFYTHESEELQNLIYGFMVEYYDLNREFSFSIVDNGLKGILLAFLKTDNYKMNNFFERINALSNKTEQETALNLFNYLEICGKEVKNIINNDDIILGLFVSIQKGCGKQLLSKLIESGRKRNMKNIYLWTDTTCDYEYYRKNNFVLVKEFETLLNDKPIKTLIYKKTIKPA